MGTGRKRIVVGSLVLSAAALSLLLARSLYTSRPGEPRTKDERVVHDAIRRSVEHTLGRPLTDAEGRMIVIERTDGRFSGARVEGALADELDRRKAATSRPATAPEP